MTGAIYAAAQFIIRKIRQYTKKEWAVICFGLEKQETISDWSEKKLLLCNPKSRCIQIWEDNQTQDNCNLGESGRLRLQLNVNTEFLI